MEFLAFLKSLTPEERRFIAQLDYGLHADRHLEALDSVVQRGGRFEQAEYWHPYEVIELGAHALTPGHDREFTACTLLVVSAVMAGFDQSTDLAGKLHDRAEDYDKLDPIFRESILAAYAAAGL